MDSTLEKGGVFKFAKVSNVDARIALANKQLDEQLGAFTVSWRSSSVEDVSEH